MADDPDSIKRLNQRVREMAALSLERGMREHSVVDLICGQLSHEDIVCLARNQIEHQVARSSEQRAAS